MREAGIRTGLDVEGCGTVLGRVACDPLSTAGRVTGWTPDGAESVSGNRMGWNAAESVSVAGRVTG